MANEFVTRTGLIVSGSTYLPAATSASKGYILSFDTSTKEVYYMSTSSVTVTVPGSDTQVIYNNGGSFGASSNFVFSGSNVGIGTSNPAYKFDVRGQGYFATVANTNQLTLGDITNGTIAAISQTNENLSFLTGASTTRLFISSSGNVGIGTTNPSGKLDIVPSSQNGINIARAGGYASVYGSNDLVFETDSVFYFGVYTPRLFSVNGSFYVSAGGLTSIGKSSANATLDVTGSVLISGSLTVSGSSTFTNIGPAVFTGSITQNASTASFGGLVGIGTTTPSQKLSVVGSGNTYIQVNNGSNNVYFGKVSDAGTIQSDDDITFRPSSTELMRLTGTNVGIGTTSPSEILDVQKAGTVAIRVYNTSSTADAYFDAKNSTGNAFFGINATGQYLYTSNNIPTLFYNSGSERMRITNAGNVGIGETAPEFKLVVTDTNNYKGILVNGSNAPVIAFDKGVGQTAEWKVGISGNDGESFSVSSGTSNTDRLFISSSGNVGIGTTSPGSKLTVIGDIATSTRVASDTINGYTGGSTPLTILTGGSQNIIFGTNNTERARISTAGDVQIGTTAYAGIGGSGYLMVKNVIGIVPDNTANTNNRNWAIQANGQFSGSLDFVTSAASASFPNDAYRVSFTRTGGVVASSFTGSFSGSVSAPGSTTQIVYNSGGALAADSGLVYSGSRVGIGTATPATTLALAGSTATTFGLSLEPSGWNSAKHRFTVPTSGDTSMWSFNWDGSAVDSIAYATSAITLTQGVITFSTTGSANAPAERFKIDSSGNLFLNTYLFAYEDVSYTRLYRPNGSAGIYLGGAGDPSNYYDNNYHYFRTDGGSANLGVWNSTGLGIGTTNPTSKLHVSGASATIDVDDTAVGNPGFRIMSGGSTQASLISNTSTGNTTLLVPAGSLTLRAAVGNIFITGSTFQTGSGTITGDLTVGGTITAQKLNVQQITSSVIYSSGSNIFGNEISNTQTFTGSLQVTGSTHYLLGNVGIGTASPSSLLNVSSATQNSSALVVQDDARKVKIGRDQIEVTDLSDVASTMYLQPNSNLVINGTAGNVGIGTQPSYKLHVDANTDSLIKVSNGTETYIKSTFYGYSSGYDVIQIGDTYGKGNNGVSVALGIDPSIIAGGAFSGYEIALPDLTEFITANGPSGSATDWNQAVLVITGSRIGIGTGTPTQTLEVGGNILASKLGVGGAINISYDLYNNGTTYLNGETTVDDNLYISGNVGIGTTSPGSKLNVTDGFIRVNGSDTDQYFLEGVRTGVSTTLRIYDNSSIPFYDAHSSMLFRANQNGGSGGYIGLFGGNVGIGTSTPSQKLEIFDSSDVALRIHKSAVGEVIMGISGSAGADATQFITNTNGFDFRGDSNTFPGGGSSRLFISSSGNVGIGTTSPSEKLDVVGRLKLTNVNNGYGWIYAQDVNHTIIIRGDRDGTVDNYTNYYQYGGDLSNGRGHFFYTGGPLANQSVRFSISDDFSVFHTGNVGIGTTSPGAKLTVYSDTTADGILVDVLSRPRITLRDRGNSDTILGTGDYGLDDFFIDTYSGNAFAIDGATRNVGIGTTTPQAALSIAATGSKWVNDNNTYFQPTGSIFLSAEATSDKDNWIGIAGNYNSTTGSANLLLQANYRDIGSQAGHYVSSQGISLGNAVFTIGKLTTSTSTTTPPTKVEQFRIDGSGNVGIGTNNPIYKLHVVGSTYVNSGTLFIDSGEYIRWGNSAQGIRGVNDTSLEFVVGSSTRMYVSSSGNVGIGTTSPNYKLEISGSTNVYDRLDVGTGIDFPAGTSNAIATFKQAGSVGGIILQEAGGTSNDRILKLNSNGDEQSIEATYRDTGPYGNLAFKTGGSTRMYISSSGNVGIGTTSPSSKLDVSVVPSAAWMNLINANETAFTLTTFNNGTNNGSSTYAFKHGLYYNTTENAAVTFYRGPSSTGGFLTFTTDTGIERMRIDGSGNVGIGTTSPSYRLHVSGAIAIENQGTTTIETTTFSGSLTTNTNIASVPTASFKAAFFDYYVASGSVNMRAGTVMAVHNNSTSRYTDTSTGDIGTTAAVDFSTSIVAGSLVLTANISSGTWEVKTAYRAL